MRSRKRTPHPVVVATQSESLNEVARHLEWDGTSRGWGAILDIIAATRFAVRSPDELRAMNRCEAPGFYVSAMRDDRTGAKILVEGPFRTHMEALVAVWPVSQAWGEVDHRSAWYFWGTARVHATKEG